MIRRSVLMILLLAAAAGQRIHAQYNEPRGYEPSNLRIITAGACWRDFAPRGSNPVADSLAIRYNTIMPMLSFRQGLVDIFFGYTRYRQLDADRTAILLGTVISSDMVLSGGRGSALLLPLMLAADYTKSESGGLERESFNIASVGIGTGLKYRLTSRAVDLTANVGAAAQYAVEGLSTGTGFSGTILAETTVVLRSVNIGEGICLGYRFRLQTWSMNEAKFNYRAVMHGPFIGIAF